MAASLAAVRAIEKQPAHAVSRPRVWAIVGFAERALAAVLLAALLPVLVLLAVVVAALSRRTPFVALARAGRNGNCIWLLKLRTMWEGAECVADSRFLVERIENAPVPEFKTGHDPRVTSPFAAFCRRYSIDEIPQLWHVVAGDMALVGPRPLTYPELSTYYGDDAQEVLSVKPGLTGLWQVRGRNSLTYRQRRELDLHLVRHRSLHLYVSILARTLPAVFSGINAG